jgi:hypothetical protein
MTNSSTVINPELMIQGWKRSVSEATKLGLFPGAVSQSIVLIEGNKRFYWRYRSTPNKLNPALFTKSEKSGQT